MCFFEVVQAVPIMMGLPQFILYLQGFFDLELQRARVTKDKGLKKRCRIFKVPFIDLESPEQDAIVVDEKLKEIQALKEYLK